MVKFGGVRNYVVGCWTPEDLAACADLNLPVSWGLQAAGGGPRCVRWWVVLAASGLPPPAADTRCASPGRPECLGASFPTIKQRNEMKWWGGAALPPQCTNVARFLPEPMNNAPDAGTFNSHDYLVRKRLSSAECV